MFVQTTKSTRADKTYLTYLVRESFRLPSGPRSRTVCNITDLPPDTRDLIAASLKGQVFLPAGQLQLETALDYGGLAVLNVRPLASASLSLPCALSLAPLGT